MDINERNKLSGGNQMTVKVAFTESSKAVTAHVTVEDNNGDEALAEAKRLFDEAKAYATQCTMRKLR